MESLFLSVDFPLLRESLGRLISESNKYFPEELNESLSMIVTRDQHIQFQGDANEALKLFDAIDHDTHAIRINLRRIRPAKNIGLVLPTGIEFFLFLDLARKILSLQIYTIGSDAASAIVKLVTLGIELINISIPDHLLKRLEDPLRMFLQDHPSPEANIFVMLRFRNATPFPTIVNTVRDVCSKFGLSALRADDKEYSPDLLTNVLTYIYGCGSSIAIFDQINARDFNPNVAIEVGIALARGTPLLLLKDESIGHMPSDIVGQIYRSFNTYEPEKAIMTALDKWLRDQGLGRAPS
jgi:hypothetical protein